MEQENYNNNKEKIRLILEKFGLNSDLIKKNALNLKQKSLLIKLMEYIAKSQKQSIIKKRNLPPVPKFEEENKSDCIINRIKASKYWKIMLHFYQKFNLDSCEKSQEIGLNFLKNNLQENWIKKFGPEITIAAIFLILFAEEKQISTLWIAKMEISYGIQSKYIQSCIKHIRKDLNYNFKKDNLIELYIEKMPNKEKIMKNVDKIMQNNEFCDFMRKKHKKTVAISAILLAAKISSPEIDLEFAFRDLANTAKLKVNKVKAYYEGVVGFYENCIREEKI